jgi:rubrerythrin
MVHRKLTTLEAVALAVRSEIDSAGLYRRLAERVKNPQVKELLRGLAEEEERHEKGLMKLYRSMLNGQEPSVPGQDGRGKSLPIDPEADIASVIAAARDKENSSEKFYKDAASSVTDFKTRQFFLDLAETERKHFAMLQAQLDKLADDPHWFDREESKPVHLGP